MFGDEDNTDTSSCEDEQMQDLTDALKAVTLTEPAHPRGNGMQLDDLEEEGLAGFQWLFRCAMGFECSDHDSETDHEWLPPSQAVLTEGLVCCDAI